jgi:predicted metal-dependent hydrolase
VADGIARNSQLPLLQEEPEHAAFVVRESLRAKRLSVRVFPHGRVEVVVPRGTKAAEAQAFVASNENWIRSSLREMSDSGLSADVSLPERISFSASDESWELEYKDAGNRLRLVEATRPPTAKLTVYIGCVSQDTIRKKLRHWTVLQGRRLLLPELRELAHSTGLQFTDARIGRQRTRWGSCTQAGRIHLNCALLFLSSAQARYVMIHELCHLCVMNHSAAYWRKVESLVPEYRMHEKEINSAWSKVPGWLFYQ